MYFFIGNDSFLQTFVWAICIIICVSNKIIMWEWSNLRWMTTQPWEWVSLPPIYPIHIFTLACLLFVVIYIYIYLKYTFWCRQPVVHVYDWWRRWVAPGKAQILYDNRRGTPPTKFYFPDKTYTFNPLEKPEDLSKCVKLLQSHYIGADNILFSIQEAYLKTHCIGHGEDAPLMSLYYEYGENPHAMIAAFPAEVYTGAEGALWKVYFWNYICVHRDFKNQYLTRPLIQTHEYRQRPAIQVSIFRCDTVLQEGIVPITRGYTHTYYLRGGKIRASLTGMHVMRISTKSIDIMGMFMEYIQTIKSAANSVFKVYMTPSTENMIALMDAGILYVYALISSSKIVGLYFFKNVCTTYEELDNDIAKPNRGFDGSRTVHCFGSISSTPDPEIFGEGFLYAVKHLVKSSRGQFNVLLLDDTSCNGVGVLPIWNRQFTPIFSNEYAYYAYNWRVPGMPLSSHECLFII